MCRILWQPVEAMTLSRPEIPGLQHEMQPVQHFVTLMLMNGALWLNALHPQRGLPRSHAPS